MTQPGEVKLETDMARLATDCLFEVDRYLAGKKVLQETGLFTCELSLLVLIHAAFKLNTEDS